MMTEAKTPAERRLRLSASILVIGLGVQFGTLLVNRPLSFLVFAFIGCPLVLLGLVLYLWAVLVHSER